MAYHPVGKALGADIHPTALVSPGASLADGVEVGPYCIIESDVRLGRGTRLGAFAQVLRFTSLGENNNIGSHVILGGEPMDLKFKGEESYLEIGHRNTIREFSTVHRGTLNGGGLTKIGDDNFIMAYCHITHDCQLGNHNIVPNGMQMAGHVVVGDFVTFGATVGVHQFCRIGSHAMIGMMSKITRDILPYSLADGHPAEHYHLNTIGLKRRDIRGNEYSALSQAMKALRVGRTEIVNDLSQQSVHVAQLLQFIEARSLRGLSGFADE